MACLLLLNVEFSLSYLGCVRNSIMKNRFCVRRLVDILFGRKKNRAIFDSSILRSIPQVSLYKLTRANRCDGFALSQTEIEMQVHDERDYQKLPAFSAQDPEKRLLVLFNLDR
jgi:hypothetical protein